MAHRSITPHFVTQKIRNRGISKWFILFSILSLFLLWIGLKAFLPTHYSQEFCTSCHIENDENKPKNKLTIHHSRKGDVPADCVDCHTLNPLTHRIFHEIQARYESLQKLIDSTYSAEQLEEKRLRLAKQVWETMKSNNSSECRACHTDEAMNPRLQTPEAKKQHLDAFKSGATCIDCHKGIAHQISRDQFSEGEIKALEAPNPAFIRKIPEMYLSSQKKVEKQKPANPKK